jgi:hypothetical protein
MKNQPIIGRSTPTAKGLIIISRAIPTAPPRRASRPIRSWPTAKRGRAAVDHHSDDRLGADPGSWPGILPVMPFPNTARRPARSLLGQCRQRRQRHQQHVDYWNDPNDANIPVNTNFQMGYVQHLTNTWGVSTNGGVGYYIMDNEHSLWSRPTRTSIRWVRPCRKSLGKSWPTPRWSRAWTPRRWWRDRKSGVGRAISTAATISNGPGRTTITTRRTIPTAPPTAAGITCPGCSTSFTSTTSPTASGSWIISRSIATRRKAT